MLFADFKNYKIIKEFKYTTVSEETKISTEAAVLELKKLCGATFSRMVAHQPLAVSYELTLNADGVADDDDCTFFLGFVNIACAEFFRVMVLPERRTGEYRLDAPDRLKGLKTSYSLIKKACNNKTINDIFNLTIRYKDLVFVLCDEKDFIDTVTFIHTTDELENNICVN